MSALLSMTGSDRTAKRYGRASRFALMAFALAGGLMSMSTSAVAAAASNLSADAVAVPETVSVSRAGLVTYAAYRVTVRNSGGNTTNKVVYEGTSQVLANGSPATPETADVTTNSTAPATESTNPSCTPTGSTFRCLLGQMPAGDSRTFLLIFKAPVALDGTTPNEQIKLKSLVSFCSNPTCGTTNNANVGTLPAYTTLITTDDPAIASSVKSVIPSFGGAFFTGVGNKTSPTGLHTTKVDVPKGAPVSNNAIEETNVTSTVPFNCDASKPNYICYGFASRITVNRADTGAKIYLTGNSLLTITLTQDVSTIQKGTKIANVQLFYQYDIIDPVTGLPGNPALSQALVPIPACTAGLPAINQPCVTGRTVVPKGTPGAGNFVFVILARDNGRVSW